MPLHTAYKSKANQLEPRTLSICNFLYVILCSRLSLDQIQQILTVIHVIVVILTKCFLWKSMSENGRETFSGWSLFGSAARLRDSNAIIKSTHPAGRRALNSEMNSAPKISSRSRSNSRSIPTHHNVMMTRCIAGHCVHGSALNQCNFCHIA